MKVAYVVRWVPPVPLTGTEYYLLGLAERMRAHHETVVVTTDGVPRGGPPPRPMRAGTGSPSLQGIPVERVRATRRRTELVHRLRLLQISAWDGMVSRLGPLGAWLDAMSREAYAPGLARRLARGDEDLVHTAGVPHPTNWLASRACRASGSRHVITPFVNAGVPESYRPPWVLQTARRAAAAVAVTPWEATFLADRGVPSDRIHVVPPGLDLEAWEDADGRRLREELGLDPSDFVVLLPRKNEDKGTLHVLDALARAAPDVGSAAVLILDEGSLPGYEERVRRLTAQGLRVWDLGYVTGRRKRDAFDACDVLAQPSRIDAFGLVYLEAWAREKPVIASRVGAIPDVVQDGVVGLLVPHGDVDAIASALRTLHRDRAAARQLGRQGRRVLEERYTLDRVVRDLAAVYESLA